MIELQQSAKPLAANDFTSHIIVRDVSLDELVVDPLVRALGVIMNHELFDRFAQMPLTENDHLLQTFGFYCKNESFGEGVQCALQVVFTSPVKIRAGQLSLRPEALEATQEVTNELKHF